MLKKSLIISSIFCLIVLVSSTVFGTNFVNDTRTGLQNMGNGIKNVVEDVTNSAKDVKNDMTNTENNAENKAGNDAKDMGQMTNEGYTATRTDAITNTTTTNNTLIWTILAIAGAIIVALVWYYALQTNKDDRNNHE